MINAEYARTKALQAREELYETELRSVLAEVNEAAEGGRFHVRIEIAGPVRDQVSDSLREHGFTVGDPPGYSPSSDRTDMRSLIAWEDPE